MSGRFIVIPVYYEGGRWKEEERIRGWKGRRGREGKRGDRRVR